MPLYLSVRSVRTFGQRCRPDTTLYPGSKTVLEVVKGKLAKENQRKTTGDLPDLSGELISYYWLWSEQIDESDSDKHW